jgi:predicted O-methyltransferase YrrM
MKRFFFRLQRFLWFYRTALTKYQLHSPIVYAMAEAVLEDKRWYYAFRDVENIRQTMLKSRALVQVQDFGVGSSRTVSLKTVVDRASSSTRQGRQLFRLANWVNPDTILELGTSVGIGALYLISGARSAKLITLEGCPQTAATARENFDLLGFQQQATILVGRFEETLPEALQTLQQLDFVYVDGHHRGVPTLEYFEKCLPYAHEKTVFVFDDVDWSPEMAVAWRKIQQHDRVTLSVEFFDFAVAFINPDFKQKQHLNIVPSSWKIWKFI